MPLTHLEVLVEEPSMEAALESLLPMMVGDATFNIYEYSGKQALLKRLPNRLRTYRHTLQAGWLILVVLDQDDDDCHELKQVLEASADAAGLLTKTAAAGGSFTVLNRIAIEELEAWYFGDWSAVRTAFPRAPAGVPARAAYRNPDAIKGGTWEAFKRVMQQAGYYADGFSKRQTAEAVAPYLLPARNTSRSFQVLRDALLEAAIS